MKILRHPDLAIHAAKNALNDAKLKPEDMTVS